MKRISNRILRAGLPAISFLAIASIARCDALHQDLKLFAKGVNNKRIYLNEHRTGSTAWNGWTEVSGGKYL